MILAAPNGARRNKSDHPGIPVSMQETIDVAVASHAAGADGLHLHVRDQDGGHSIDPGLYREALNELSNRLPGWPVQVTTESGGIFDVQAQYDTLRDLRPAWASLCVREAARDLDLAPRIYDLCRDQGTDIQHILFDAEDAALMANWISRGWIDAEPSVILVLGRYTADMNSDPNDLEPFLDSLPPVQRWMLCAFGPNEHPCLAKAHSLGGDVRIGFENSFLQPNGTPWPDMATSITSFRTAIGH